LDNKTLFPWEAAILHGKTKEEMTELLAQLNRKPGYSPSWIPRWAQCGEILLAEIPIEMAGPFSKNQKKKDKTQSWTEKEKENLRFYWNLELLGYQEIADLLERPPLDILTTASALQLPAKPQTSLPNWCGINWEFQLDSPTDPKALDSNTQRLVAETSATRFSLLYETLEHIEESCAQYRNIQKELDRILKIHHRIFSKYVSIKSRKYNYQGISPWIAQNDLEQAGKTAVFECLRRWHPNRNIRFSRGAVCMAITREMISWVEQQRLVELPDKIRSVARKLKHANESGNLEEEYKRLEEESGANCVKEAAKHQHTYAYLNVVPLMDNYEENLAEAGGIPSGSVECLGEFAAFASPTENLDLGELLLSATQTLSPQEKRAVLAYHGILPDGTHTAPKTLEEIGSKEGVTKERIRQRIAKAKLRMRRWMEQKNIHCVHDAFAHQ